MPRPPKAAKWNNMFDVLSSSDVNVAADDEEFNNQDSEEDPGMAEMKLEENEQSSASVLFNRDAFAREKKWTEFEEQEDLESHEVRSNLSVPDRFDAEWKFDSYSDEVSKLPLEACSDVASVERDANIVECWEVLVDDDGKEIYESNASLLQYHDCDRLDLTDAPSSENVTFLMGEGGELEPFEFESVVAKAPEEASINSKENVHTFVANDAKEIYENKVSFLQHHELECVRPDLTDVPSSENGTFLDREGVELKSLEFQSVVTKAAEVALISTKENVRSGNVLAPIEKCERKQNQSNLTDRAYLENSNSMSEGVLTDIQSSDFESVIIKVHSKLEIDQLKKRCHKLESKPSSSSDHYSVEDCESSSEESVLIVGGSNGNSWLPDLSLYSPLQDSVVSLCPMTFSRSYASVAKLNGELYVFGGVLDGVWYDTVESYNPIINQWTQRPYLNQRKGSMAGASVHEKIFAIGGGNGVDCFSEVEFLDLNIGSWMFTQSMLVKRNAPAAADMNGAVYVAGGYDGKEYLRSVERFDPRTHAWTSLANMHSKRGCHSLVPFKDKLYALGGYDGEKMVSTVEVFDPRVGLWMTDEPMTVSRGYFGSFVCGGKIYVIGGMKDGEYLDVVRDFMHIHVHV
ncbi:hypothetical protein DH2020_010327 [Rehmannia glutinosa]|uniref:Uncharacterized protein n=1 Tax=Rehmannia glutinosa TaxID=99300 RepID=A0ABR0XAB2_REHGL